MSPDREQKFKTTGWGLLPLQSRRYVFLSFFMRKTVSVFQNIVEPSCTTVWVFRWGNCWGLSLKMINGQTLKKKLRTLTSTADYSDVKITCRCGPIINRQYCKIFQRRADSITTDKGCEQTKIWNLTKNEVFSLTSSTKNYSNQLMQLCRQ